VDVDPLSLLCRLATSVPPPRFHTVKYAGVLGVSLPGAGTVGVLNGSAGTSHLVLDVYGYFQ
jgi:hypothetical protein